MKLRKGFIISFIVLLITIVGFSTSAFAATVGEALTSPGDGWQRFDDSNSNISYSGGWYQGSYPDAYPNGMLHANNIPGGVVKFDFTGTKIRIISVLVGTTNFASPNISISIDNVVNGSYSCVSSTSKQKILVYEKTNLSNTRHSVVIKSNDNKYAYLDAIDIDKTGSLQQYSGISAPNSPVNLNTKIVSNNVTLNWDNVTGATNYNIKRSATAGGPYTAIASNITGTTYTDSDVTSGNTYYYVVSAVTSNGESANSNEASITVTTSPPTLTNTTSSNKVKIGDEFTTDIAIHNVTNICAEDIKITYDSNLFEYVGATAQTGLKIYKEDTSTPGTVRFIVACQGKDNVATGDKNLIQLKFKAKSRGVGKVDIIKGRIADNATLEMDVADENCGEATIEIGGKDVNRTDSFTLLDLGIDAYYFGFNAADTDTTKYDADLDSNGKIDDGDLTSITESILLNKDYPLN